MSDYISRADAIEAIQNAYCKPCKERGDDHNEVRCRVCDYDNAIIQIDALPSAEAVSMEEHVKELNDLASAWKNKFINAEKRTEEIYDETMAKVANECKECKERLRNLRPSAEAVQGWIPCSERLPDERQDVYVTVLWDDYGDYITAYGMRTRFGWHLHSNAEGELIKGYTVIAWMPLPKPYKGGDSE